MHEELLVLAFYTTMQMQVLYANWNLWNKFLLCCTDAIGHAIINVHSVSVNSVCMYFDFLLVCYKYTRIRVETIGIDFGGAALARAPQ